MKSRILILLALIVFSACKQEEKREVNSNTADISKESLNNQYLNCFTTEDIEAIEKHYKLLEETIKSGKKYDFSKSPVLYTDKDKKWLLKTLRKSACSGSLNEIEEECPKTITYNIDCSETLIIDSDEHWSEQDYWDILIKKDGKITIHESGAAG